MISYLNIGDMTDNEEEMFPEVDENGNIVGCMTREMAHGGSKRLHPVVHLHVFNTDGSLYLQKRPAWKDIQPGKWDTAVGGHVSLGEDIEAALLREAEEELGLSAFSHIRLGHYVFESNRERELVYVYKTVYNKEITPDAEELDGGRFWTLDEIRENIGKEVFTPNFESEIMRKELQLLIV